MSILLTTSFLPLVKAESRSHTVTTESSNNFGPLSLDIGYTLNYEIRKPSSITASSSDEIIISPKDGTLVFTINYQNKRIGPFPVDMILGKSSDVPTGIPFVRLFAKPTAYIQPTISGPGQISPQYITMDNMISKEFSIYVNDDIGRFDSVVVNFPVRLSVNFGVSIGALGFNKEFSDSVSLTMNPLMSEKINIKKFYDTQLTLQVTDGSRSGYIKVYPKLTYDYGNSLPSSVKIYVNGAHKTTINSNQWSSDINVGSGSHNFQAKFSESRSSNNNAITFLESQSNVERFNVKSTPSSGTTPTQSISSYQPRQTSSSQDYTIPLIILGIAGGGGAAAVIIMKNKKKSAKPTIQAVSESKSAQVLAKSDEFTHKKEVLDKFATGEISKEEYLKHVGYEKKEEKKSESTKKTKRPKKSKAKSKKKDDSK